VKIPVSDIQRDLESYLNMLGVRRYRPAAREIIHKIVLVPVLVAFRAEYDQINAHQRTLREEISELLQELEIAYLPEDPDAEDIELLFDDNDDEAT
jgi:DNA-binding transcriptional LysR family regulator